MARRLFAVEGIQPNATQVSSLARQIRGYEAGEHLPRDWTRAYAKTFGKDVGDLFQVGRAVHGCLPCAATTDLEDDVKRRTLLGLMATTAVDVATGREAEGLRTKLSDSLRGSASEMDADDWERVAHDYAREVGALPASALLRELLDDFGEICALLPHAGEHVRSRLIRTTGQMATLIAITLTNLGEPRHARRWWRTAGRAADEVGDPVEASLVRGRRAVFSLYEQRSGMATLSLAEDAIGVGAGARCAGVASGYAAKAQSLAGLGRHREAVKALDELFRVFDRLPDTVREDRASQWGWSAQRLHHVASHVHTFGGSADHAARAQDLALAHYPSRNYQGRAQIELHRAACLLRAGEVDEGARHAVRVLQGLPAGRAGDGLLRRTALTALGVTPSAAVRRPAVREAYESLALTVPGEG